MINLETFEPRATVRKRESTHFSLESAWHATARYRPVLALVIIMIIAFSIRLPAFRSEQNIQNLLTGVAVLGIIAVGMTFVLISGGVDISTGAQVALSGYFFAKITQTGMPQWLALIAVLVFGVAVGGLVNGVLIGRFGLSFFVVTLASMTGLTGVVNLWSGTNAATPNSSFVNALAVSKYLGLQGPIWIMIATFVLAVYVQKYTYLGRDIYATGGSRQAARLSGINTSRTLVTVYAIVGLTAAVASLVSMSRIGVASPQVDNNLPLEAIAAALLGGTALTGGAGGVEGTLFGVLFIGILANGLNLSGVPSFWQQVVTGVILVAAVLGNNSNVRMPRFGNRSRRRLPEA
jgi:ribose transport system permease protein